MRPMRSERGTTLFELVVTLAVVATLTTLAGTSFTAMADHSREQAQVQAIKQRLQEARSMARSRLRDVKVSTSPGALTLSPSGDGPTVSELGDRIASMKIVDDADGALTFAADGSASELMPVTVRIVGASGQVYDITVFPAIGTLRMEG